MSLSSAYVDESGRPRLQTSIVGFLDLLGFSQSVLSAESDVASQQLLNKIVSAIGDSRDYVRSELGRVAGEHPDGLAIKFFSDNLVLGYTYDGSNAGLATAAWFIVSCAQHYQLRMALNGLFLRGGLTHGPVCLTDEIIFGRSLIECYQLESKAAVVPRIILSEPLSQILVEHLVHPGCQPSADRHDAVCRDVDGWWFVNYLEAAVHEGVVDWSMIERHKQSVLQSLSGTHRHDVLPKFGWSCRYHNMFCHWHRNDPNYTDSFRIDRVDERSTICRLSDWPPKHS